MNLLLISWGNPFVAPAGTEIFVRNLALGLAKRGISVDLLCGGDRIKESSGTEMKEISIHKIRLISIPYLRALDFRRKCAKNCTKLIRESKIDAVIAFGAGTFSGYIFDRIKKLRSRPLLVFYAMDSMKMEYERSKVSNEVKGLLTRLKRWIWYTALIKYDKSSCLNSDLILASSNDTVNHLIADYGILPTKIKLLYEGIPDDFAAGINIIDPDIPTFLHIAGGPRKGTDFFLKAMRLLEDRYDLRAKAVIIRASRSNIMQAEAIGVEAKTYKYISTLELKRQYASCTALISPSLSEGFCLPVVEAAMFGKPTIAFGSGSLPELINDGVDGFIVPVGAINRLTERMYQISEDNGLRERMFLAAKKKGQKLSINECSQKLAKILTKNS